MSKVLYKEKQTLWWLGLIMVAIGLPVLVSGINQLGSKPMGLGLSIFIFCLISAPAMLFYNLKITITEEFALAKFGPGLFKRKVVLKDLDISRAEITSLPLLAGIGYRYSSRGLFLNTKPGPALFIPGKSGKKHFFVGTQNGEEIIKILKDRFNKS
jgi:hypothetical protein